MRKCPNFYHRLLENWAALYTNPTAAEKALEPHIAALGLRYRSQHPFWGICIADFVLLDEHLVIEVDGKSHREKVQIQKDLTNAVKLKTKGWDVVRISNQDVFRHGPWILAQTLASPRANLEELQKKLRDFLDASGVHSKPRAPAPKPAPKSRSRASQPKV